MQNDFPKGPERRNSQRLEAELPVRLELGGIELVSNTENISCGGMFLPVKKRLKEHNIKNSDDVTAFITIPDKNKVVKLTGNVCRIQSDNKQEPVGVAIEFNGLYDDNRLEIDSFIKKKLLN